MKKQPVDVCYGSLAEVEAHLRCVRSSPNSRHHLARSVRPFSANNGHWLTSKNWFRFQGSTPTVAHKISIREVEQIRNEAWFFARVCILT
jgi:hypothetical protein